MRSNPAAADFQQQIELRELARAVLTACEWPDKQVALNAMQAGLQAGCSVALEADGLDVRVPGRPEKPLTVAAQDVPRRGLAGREGRAALLHAIAHIEFNAINLACDAVQRFSGMPETYYRDWAQVALDEARHFALLQTRLADFGYAYGDFPAHDGLWQMAENTRSDCLSRMALVPRLLEARGLDVTPGMIDKLRNIGDAESVAVLEIILAEEVGHVAIGTYWFNFCCQQAQKDPETAFIALLQTCGRGALRGPFNREARLQSGFTEYELAQISLLGRG